ncbi:MAG: glycosyltransferase family 4 protein [Bacteroidaceae bacterium]|nr:glycosyltransferase family 4 protein [Bacteroidaceae bacterium]
MKIVEIIPNLHSGGAEKFVVDLINELSERGNECSLVTLFELSSDDFFYSFISKKVNKQSLGKKMGFDIKCLYRLYRYVKKEKPDVVHAHIGSITYLILVVLLYRKCDYYATIHSDAKLEAGGGIHKIIRKFLFKMNLVTPITISEESEKSFDLFYGRTGNLIPNGCSEYQPERIDSQHELRKDVDFLFVHVASIQPVKNQMTLLKAFKRLLDDGVRARLLLIGRNANEQIFNLLKPYFFDNIIYLGEQRNPRAFMSICDAFCLASLWEGMPISIIEAFSVGCIPITTPVGGCVNMIEDEVNGLLAEGTSVDAYYQVFKRFVKLESTQKEELSKNAVNTFEQKYSINITANKYIDLFANNHEFVN